MSSQPIPAVRELPRRSNTWDVSGGTGQSQRTRAEVRRLYEEALVCLRSNRDGEACRLLQQVLQLEPQNAAAMSWLGLCVLRLQGRYADADALCQHAAALAPDNPEVVTNLGRVQRLAGDNASAYRSFLLAYRRDPANPAPAVELARMGVRRPPVLHFLPRSHWCNRLLGRARYRLHCLIAAPARRHGA